MPEDSDVAAARLALLAVRASVSRKGRIRGSLLRIASTRERFTPQQVVHLLAAAPKPLVCSARDAGGSIELAYSHLNPGTDDFAWHAATQADARRRGGYLWFLAEKHPAPLTDLTVHCVGRDESQLVTVADVERWYADYLTKEVNIRADWADNPLCLDWPEYTVARQFGAAAVLIFASPADEPGKAYLIVDQHV